MKKVISTILTGLTILPLLYAQRATSINSNYTYRGYGGGGYIDCRDTISVFEYSNYGLRKTFPLLEAGIALGYKLKNGLTIYISSQYLSD